MFSRHSGSGSGHSCNSVLWTRGFAYGLISLAAFGIVTTNFLSQNGALNTVLPRILLLSTRRIWSCSRMRIFYLANIWGGDKSVWKGTSFPWLQRYLLGLSQILWSFELRESHGSCWKHAGRLGAASTRPAELARPAGHMVAAQCSQSLPKPAVG